MLALKPLQSRRVSLCKAPEMSGVKATSCRLCIISIQVCHSVRTLLIAIYVHTSMPQVLMEVTVASIWHCILHSVGVLGLTLLTASVAQQYIQMSVLRMVNLSTTLNYNKLT